MSNDTYTKIKEFYEIYHQERPREADSWVKQEYWPAFIGQTLEIGAGTMFPLKNDYVAVDLTFTASQFAQEQSIPSLMADGRYLPFSAKSFDTVACYDVLEHILTPEQFLGEMCRISRQAVVVAGPNYVGQYNGGLDRNILARIWAFLSGHGRGAARVENPHLVFDENWHPDHDAVCKPNARWVADQLKSNGLVIQTLRTWEHAFPILNKFPVLRNLGQFMLVVGEKA